jgi:creatinine amidohydrolase
MSETILWGQYEHLRPAQIEAIRSQSSLAYLPWGALEWHSYHNPIGLDGMQAHGQCVRLAAQTGGVVLPPVYVASDTIKPFKGFPHSINHSEALVHDLCLEFLEQLVEEKFRAIIVITGHMGGKHTEALEKACNAFQAAHPEVKIWFTTSYEVIKDVYPANHAARGETSTQLYLAPELVDLSLMDHEPDLDTDGVWGEDPRRASAAEGEAMMHLYIERMTPKILEMIQ